MHIILLLLIVCLIYFGIHYFVYHRIANGLALSKTVRKYLKKFFLIAALSLIFGGILSRLLFVGFLLYIGFAWIGILSIAFTIFLLKAILLFIFPNQQKPFTIIALILLFLTSGLSLYNGLRVPGLKGIEIPVKKLPEELSGFTIIQLSDLHLRSTNSTKWLESIVKKTNECNPDLIVITGDLIDEAINNVERFINILRKLKSRYGVIAITGNHDFDTGIEHFLEFTKRSNMKILRNNKITVAKSIEIVGIDDDTGRKYSGAGPDLPLAMKDCDPDKPIILLSHRPQYFKNAVEMGIDLQLSGHSHAGQIPPMVFIVRFIIEYPYGLYQYESSHIYATSGTGTWGPPMRLFSHSEIVKIILCPMTDN